MTRVYVDRRTVDVETFVKNEMLRPPEWWGTVENTEARLDRLADGFARLIKVLDERGVLSDGDIGEVLGVCDSRVNPYGG